MTEPRVCIECGSHLTAEAPDGPCPVCLLKLALDTASQGGRFSPTDAPALAGGKIHYFGDYELIEELGRGGMGVVYKARQMSLSRIVAVKMMRPGLLLSEADIQRFHVEAEAAASLQHPNIVAIHEVGEHDGLCYFSMDFVAGQSLAEIVRHEPLSAQRAAAYVQTIAEAVHYAHQHGLLHRDLKPANVIVDAAQRPRITDFGLARKLEGDSRLTQTGAVLGTPSYMPPEQAAGRSEDLGVATDVYSLGAILYELLCGRPPFQAESPVDTLLLVLHAEPVSPRLLNPRLDRDLETISLKCLEKDGRRRYASAQDLADDLGRFLANKPIAARRIGTANRGWRWCRRNPWQAIATAGLALLALLAMFTAITLRDRLWRSIVDQGRSERLAGNRARSLELLAEAAQMKKSDDLRQEAAQTILTPGIRLRQEISTPSVDEIVLSPDSRFMVLAGTRYVKRKERSGNSSRSEHFPAIDVWDLDAMEKLSEIVPAHHAEPRPDEVLAFSPAEPILAQYRADYFPRTNIVRREPPKIDYLGIQKPSVVFWNPINGQQIGEVECRDEKCREIRGNFHFSQDGRRLVGDGEDCGSWVIDVSARNSVIADTDGSVLGFSSSDQVLLNCGDRLRRHNLVTGDEFWVSPEGSSIVSVTPDAHFAVLGSNGSLIVWDAVAEKQITLLPRAGNGEVSGVMSGNGKMVAIVDRSQPDTIRLYDTTASRMQERTLALGSNIKIILTGKQVVFSPDGSFLAAFGGAGKQGYVWVWDTHTGAQVAMLKDNHTPMWTATGRFLITQGPITTGDLRSGSMNFGEIVVPDGAVNVWEVFGPPPVYLLPDRIGSLAFSQDETQLLSNGVTWDVARNGAHLELRKGAQRAPSESIAVAAGEQLWAAGCDEKQYQALLREGRPIPIRLWELAPSYREVVLEPAGYSGIYQKMAGFPLGFAMSPDGSLLISASTLWEGSKSSSWGGGTSVLELWDLETKTRLAILSQDEVTLPSIDISPNGRLVAARFGPSGVSIRELVTGKEIQMLDAYYQPSTVVKFSTDGKFLFSASAYASEDEESPIFVHEIGTGRRVGKWKSHHGGVVRLATSADGTLLVSGGSDRTICLWDVRTGRRLASWEAHQSDVSALAITRDGEMLVSGSTDGALKIWNLGIIRRELSLLGLGW